jgi:hypothetical protein
VFRAAVETETTQENIQDWLELDEGDNGFQHLKRGRNCCSNILYLFLLALPILLNFQLICVLFFCFSPKRQGKTFPSLIRIIA